MRSYLRANCSTQHDARDAAPNARVAVGRAMADVVSFGIAWRDKAGRALLAFGLLAAGWSLPSASASGAAVTHLKVTDDLEAIAVEGDIAPGDVETFRRISVQYRQAVVVLDSRGGALSPAIDIGKIIRISGYATLVPDDAICASSCALIWVAGSTRLLSPKGHVGFHASYKDNNGRLEESGVGNALVGNYLTLLNLPERAIIFATSASPDQILWLDRANQATSGIEFKDFEVNLASQDSSPPQASPRILEPVPGSGFNSPPVQAVRQPPARPYSSPATPPTMTPPDAAYSGTGRQQGDSNWIQYSTGANGMVSYYSGTSLKRTGSVVRVWVLRDLSRVSTEKARSSKELWEYQCDDQTSRLLTSANYDRNGAVIGSYVARSYEQNFEPVVPDSVGMTLWEELCTQHSAFDPTKPYETIGPNGERTLVTPGAN